MHLRAAGWRGGWVGRLLLAATVAALVSPDPAASAPAAARRPPNVVLLLTDDLDLDSVAAMPNVRRLLAGQGLTFDAFFVTTPLCCPSRASILRGQYAHNHGVLRNTGDDVAGFAAFHDAGRETSTIATWLQDRGYRTALFGKYLNGYSTPAVGKQYVPPGWDEWAVGVDHAAYQEFDYRLNENGLVVDYGRAADDYLTDVLTAKATDFVGRAAADGDPFFLFLSTYAPHAPAIPAPRHEREFADALAPRGPAFNEADVSDKPAWVQHGGPMSEQQIARLDEDHRQRLRSLQAVDEGVAALVRSLERAGALDDTVIIFTSDNGFFLGEHRQPRGKNAPYEPVVHVPLIVRGPGIAAGRETAALTLNTDLAPTIADLAGAAAPRFVDGRSFAPLLRGDAKSTGRRVFLVEGFGGKEEEDEGGEPTPAFAGLRSAGLLYVEYATGERELYDLRRDPDELQNRIADADRRDVDRLASRLDALRRCRADACRKAEDARLRSPALDRAEPAAPTSAGHDQRAGGGDRDNRGAKADRREDGPKRGDRARGGPRR